MTRGPKPIMSRDHISITSMYQEEGPNFTKSRHNIHQIIYSISFKYQVGSPSLPIQDTTSFYKDLY